jgi:hypothetical protein
MFLNSLVHLDDHLMNSGNVMFAYVGPSYIHTLNILCSLADMNFV